MADTSNKNEQRNEHGFEWPVVVRNSNPHASLDYYYGPYDSIESMKSGVPAEVLVPGFTAAVQTEDGVTEYWVVSGSGSNATWEQKGLASDSLVRFKGTKANLDEVKAITDMQVGDMWLVPEDGVTDSSLEYVWTGEQWEQMGKTSSELTGTLSVTGADFTIDGTSKTTKTFNGTQNVTLDMSLYATRDEVNEVDDRVSDIEVNDGCLRVLWSSTDEEAQDFFTANQQKDVTLDLSKYPLTKNGIPEAWKTEIKSMIKQALDGYVYASGSNNDLSRSEYNGVEDVIDLNPLNVQIENGNITATGSITADSFYED